MSFRVTITSQNLGNLEKILAGIPHGLRQETEKELHRVVEKIRDLAKRFCPVDTGSLKLSIRIYVHANPAGVWHVISVRAGGYITNPKTGLKVNYAVYVEFGTSKMHAQPFLRPAWQTYRRELQRVMRKAAERVVWIRR